MSLNSEPVIELCGIISGLSHIFKLKQQQLFIFDITSEVGTASVIVRRQSQFCWQSILKVGVSYVCSNLRRSKLYQGTEDEAEVLVATSNTKISPANFHSCVVPENEKQSLSHLLSFKGTVSSADPCLQLFLLDGDIQLVLTAIAGVSSCPQLLTGDDVIVHDAHWAPSERRLTACGRTRVQLLHREPESVVRSKQSAVHTFHRFTLPPAAVDWYRRTAELISAAAGDRPVCIGGENGVLHRLLLLARCPESERSMTKEFICSPHRCIASWPFQPPFELDSLADLLTAAAADSADPSPPEDRWHHWISAAAGRRTVAALARDAAGGWQLLAAGGTSAPLLLLGTPAAEPQPGSLVCLRPRPVVERFPGTAARVYLMCAAAELTPLEGSEPAAAAAPAEAAAPRLLVHQRSGPRRAADGVWCCLHGLLAEGARRRPVLLRLAGGPARRAADLCRGRTYVLRSDDPLWTAREQVCRQLQKLRLWLANCAVLRGPDDLQFVPDSSPLTELPPDSAAALSVGELSPDATDDQLLTVRGVILERWHVRDRFAKYRGDSSISLDTHKVTLRLGDAVTADEVPLYVCEPGQWVALLGLVPGAALTAHAVRWAGGGGNTHLVTTPLTQLQVTGWSDEHTRCVAKRPRLHLPLRFLSAALAAPALTRWVSCVTVADVRRVSVSAECRLCGRPLAATVCTFVGCHGQSRPLINARARVVLDDGSAAVAAQLVGDSVRQLLAATDAEWCALTAEAEQLGEVFHIQPRVTGGRAAAPAGLLSAVCQSATVHRPIVCELKKFAEPLSAAAAGPAVQTVFCEAVMEATAEVVTRLFPAAEPTDRVTAMVS